MPSRRQVRAARRTRSRPPGRRTARRAAAARRGSQRRSRRRTRAAPRGPARPPRPGRGPCPAAGGRAPHVGVGRRARARGARRCGRRAVGGDDHLEQLARVVERERVVELALDHVLLVVGGDDQADAGRLAAGVGRGTAAASRAAQRAQQQRIAGMRVGDQRRASPRSDLRAPSRAASSSPGRGLGQLGRAAPTSRGRRRALCGFGQAPGGPARPRAARAARRRAPASPGGTNRAAPCSAADLGGSRPSSLSTSGVPKASAVSARPDCSVSRYGSATRRRARSRPGPPRRARNAAPSGPDRRFPARRAAAQGVDRHARHPTISRTVSAGVAANASISVSTPL